MGLRTKRRARHLPKLIEELEAGHEEMERRIAAPAAIADEHQKESSVSLLGKIDEYQERAREYDVEFRVQGSISHPGFDDWFKEAQGFAHIAQMTPEEQSRMAGTDSPPPG